MRGGGGERGGGRWERCGGVSWAREIQRRGGNEPTGGGVEGEERREGWAEGRGGNGGVRGG